MSKDLEIRILSAIDFITLRLRDEYDMNVIIKYVECEDSISLQINYNRCKHVRKINVNNLNDIIELSEIADDAYIDLKEQATALAESYDNFE